MYLYPSDAVHRGAAGGVTVALRERGMRWE